MFLYFRKNVPSIIENEKVKQIADKLGKSPAQIALKFLVQNGIVVIPKSTNEKRIKENFQVSVRCDVYSVRSIHFQTKRVKSVFGSFSSNILVFINFLQKNCEEM